MSLENMALKQKYPLKMARAHIFCGVFSFYSLAEMSFFFSRDKTM
ncbi:MAG: hypothetical protein RJA67_1375 [Bacteroidota bacterium]|jgi:hypothetical protein